MSNNTNNDNTNRENNLWLLGIILFVIVALIPMLFMMIYHGRSADICKGLEVIFKTLLPNVWCVFGYIGAASVGYYIASRKYKK